LSNPNWEGAFPSEQLARLRDVVPSPGDSNQVIAYRLTLSSNAPLARAFRVRQSPRESPVYRTWGLNVSLYIAAGEDPNHNATGEITEDELRARLRTVPPYTQWVRFSGASPDLQPAGRIAHGLGLKMAASAWLGSNEAENRRQIDSLVQ